MNIIEGAKPIVGLPLITGSIFVPKPMATSILDPMAIMDRLAYAAVMNFSDKLAAALYRGGAVYVDETGFKYLPPEVILMPPPGFAGLIPA